jgi:hypothetical protein
VLFQHLVGELLANIGLPLIVTVDHLDLEAAYLAAQVIEGQLHRILHMLADDTGRPGQRGDEADLDRLGRSDRGDCHRRQHDGHEGTVDYAHGCSSFCVDRGRGQESSKPPAVSPGSARLRAR